MQRQAEIELARLDYARGNYNSVRSRLESYEDAEARTLVAASWVALDDAKEAEAALRAIPATPRTQMWRCWAMLARGDTTAALGELTRLTPSAGDFLPTVLLWKAESEMRLGRGSEAAATATELQRRYPKSPEIALLEPVLQALRQAGAAAAAVPAAEATTLVQLGVFETRANALRLRDRLPPELGTAHVDEIQRGNRRYFRVSLGPFANADAAAAFAQDRLAPHGFEWRVVTSESP